MNIFTLSPLHSQQLALFGYIQLDGTTWYTQVKSKNPPPAGDVPHGVKYARFANHSWYFILTTDPNKAQRV